MQEFTTKAELARESGIDQRDPRLKNLEPDGQVKLRGGKPIFIYDKAEAKRVIMAELKAAAERYSKESK